MSNNRPTRTLIVAVGLALACAGCNSQAGPKAGGPGDPVILKMATVNAEAGYNPEIDDLDGRVKEVSGGNVRIDSAFSVGAFAPDAEQQVVSAVASGAYDLGFVGTRAFDTLGVKSFQALTTPMLIDSYELEQAVIDSDIPDRMMGSLDTLHVIGLGVLADGLRKPIAVAKPLLGPKDWNGITFGAYRSTLASQAFTALGAHQSEVIGPRRDDALDSGAVQGFEMNLLGYQRLNLWERAQYVTANVNLWPQTLAVIGNSDRLTRLTAEQRGWLTQAIHDTAARSLALVNVDASYVSELCKEGTHFANASDTEIAALHEAFGPVLKSLAGDAQTKEFIADIERLKQQTGPGKALLIPVDCGQLAASPSPRASPQPTKTTESTKLDGTWEVTYTKDEFVAAHPDQSEIDPSNYGSFILKLDHGDFSGIGTGTYVVDGDTITLYVPDASMGGQVPPPGPAAWKYRWSVYGGALTFVKLGGEEPGCNDEGPGRCEPTFLVVKPWRASR